MELSLSVLIVCVGFAYVLTANHTGEDRMTGFYYHLRSTEQTTNKTEFIETRAAKLKRHIAECTIQTNVNPDVIQKLRAGKWKLTMKNQPPALKSWSLCLLMKFNMMSEGGMLKQDIVLKHVPQSDKAKVEDVIDKCLYKKAHAPIETAWHYLSCFKNSLPSYSII